MSVTASHSVDTALVGLVAEMMGHVVHVQLDIMAVDVVMCVLTVMEHPVIKIVASVTVIVLVDSISLSAQTHVLMVA